MLSIKTCSRFKSGSTVFNPLEDVNTSSINTVLANITMSWDCDIAGNHYKIASGATETTFKIMAAVSALHGSVPSVKFAAMVLGVVASSLQVAMSESWCTASSCGDNRVCCGYNGCIMASNCLGQYCSSDSDCSKNESCCNSECSNTTSCLGYSCQYDSDCSSGQSCCSNECRDSPDCVGYFCNSASDCDKWELCCDGTCSADCLYPTPTAPAAVSTAFIVGTVAGSFAFALFVTAVIYICRRQNSAPVRHERLTNA